MPTETEIFLNRLAQGLIQEKERRQWFSELSADEQRVVLRMLWSFAAQAGARREDVADAIGRARLKPAFTPCVLMKRGDLRVAAAGVLGLPRAEHEKSFRLMLALFQIADERRRRTRCNGGCSHWWHSLAS